MEKQKQKQKQQQQKKKTQEFSGPGCWVRTWEPWSHTPHDPIFQVPAQDKAEPVSKDPISLAGMKGRERELYLF